jgi:hypothetical protein
VTFAEWLEWAEPFGLGELELTPAEFWRLTVREFYLKEAGFRRSQNRLEWLIGLQAFLTVTYKDPKPGSPERVLGWQGPVLRYPLKPWLVRD